MGGLVLVTGACGFVGSHLVDYLISQGFRVRATDLELASKTYLNPQAEFLAADLTKIEQIYPLLEGVKLIFHPAAIFDFSASPELLFRVNVGGTKNLLKAAKDFKKIKRIVIWSTASIYDRSDPNLVSDEESPLKPTNPYEHSKLSQEKISFFLAKKYHLPITILRPALIYGPRGQYGAAIPLILIGKRKIAFIPGKGDSIGAFCHVLDVCRAAEFLSKIPQAEGQIYNLVDDSRYTLKELIYFTAQLLPKVKIYGQVPFSLIAFLAGLVEWVAKKTGRKPQFEKDLVEYLNYSFLLSNQKIKKLGFKFLYPDLKLGMKETIEWYRKEGII